MGVRRAGKREKALRFTSAKGCWRHPRATEFFWCGSSKRMPVSPSIGFGEYLKLRSAKPTFEKRRGHPVAGLRDPIDPNFERRLQTGDKQDHRKELGCSPVMKRIMFR